MRPARALSVGLALLGLAHAALAQSPEQEGGRDGDKKPKARALWTDTAVIPIRLAFDRKTVYRDRDSTSTEKYPGTLTWTDAEGKDHAIDVTLRTRGHFRRQSRHCSVPPLRVQFDKDDAKGTPFAGQKSLKLVTHCRDSAEFEEYIRREYLVYRLFNLFTELSFRARLLEVTYVDQGGGKPETHAGMLLEDDDDMARRNGGKILDTKGVRFGDVDAAQSDLVSVFEYLVANTDWSLPGMHNIVLVDRNGDFLPVPYDFDWSGIVDTRYAEPDPRLGIRSTRQRVYRGPCRTHEQVQPVLEQFRQLRPEIERLYETQPGLAAGYVKDTKAYLADFYKDIATADRWKSLAATSCREGR